MIRLTGIIAGYLVVAFATAVVAEPGSGPADYQASPPETRTVESPDGAYRLVLHSSPGGATASLDATQNLDVSLWQRDLPHQFGPRIAFVGNRGTVVLLDEWINVFTDHAIVVVDVNGATLTTYATDEIAVFLGRPRSQVAAEAKFGPWMMGVPKLSKDAESVLVPMGDETLSISLSDGSISTIQ